TVRCHTTATLHRVPATSPPPSPCLILPPSILRFAHPSSRTGSLARPALHDRRASSLLGASQFHPDRSSCGGEGAPSERASWRDYALTMGSICFIDGQSCAVVAKGARKPILPQGKSRTSPVTVAAFAALLVALAYRSRR